MLTPVCTKQFEKDLKRIIKRSKKIVKFKIVAEALINEEPLDELHRDHKLLGNYVGRRECHIESDWLLIYKIQPEQIIFERMGTHSDFFNK